MNCYGLEAVSDLPLTLKIPQLLGAENEIQIAYSWLYPHLIPVILYGFYIPNCWGYSLRPNPHLFCWFFNGDFQFMDHG